MTSRRDRPRAQGRVAVAAALLAAALAAAPAVASAFDEAISDTTRATLPAAAVREAGRPSPDSVPPPLPPKRAWVLVSTKPAGLRVIVGSVEAGWSPTPPVEVLAGRLSIRAFPADPRRFDPSNEGAVFTAAEGETLRLLLDLRPHPMIRAVPTASLRLLANGAATAADTMLGTTPLRVAPARLEFRRVQFQAAGYADTVVAGAWLLEREGVGTNGPDRTTPVPPIALRSLGLPPPAPPPGPSLLGRKWFHWALIGTGSLLTGGASILRREGDRSYDRYLAATDPRVIEREFDRTVRYDRWSAATLGTGQVMLTAGLFLLVTGIGR